MAFIKWLRRKILRNRKTFYWFDLFSYRCYAIDRNVTSDSGEVVPQWIVSWFQRVQK